MTIWEEVYVLLNKMGDNPFCIDQENTLANYTLRTKHTMGNKYKIIIFVLVLCSFVVFFTIFRLIIDYKFILPHVTRVRLEPQRWET